MSFYYGVCFYVVIEKNRKKREAKKHNWFKTWSVFLNDSSSLCWIMYVKNRYIWGKMGLDDHLYVWGKITLIGARPVDCPKLCLWSKTGGLKVWDIPQLDFNYIFCW